MTPTIQTTKARPNSNKHMIPINHCPANMQPFTHLIDFEERRRVDEFSRLFDEHFAAITAESEANHDYMYKGYCLQEPEQAIEESLLQMLLGLKGTAHEMRRFVIGTVPRCLEHSKTTFRVAEGGKCYDHHLTMISLEAAEKVALKVGGTRGACVAYQMAEVRSTGAKTEIVTARQLQVLGNLDCPIHIPDVVETSAKAVHRFLRFPEPFGLWWVDRRDKLSLKPGRDYSGNAVESKLSLPFALELMATVDTPRGQLVRRCLTANPKVSLASKSKSVYHRWYNLLYDFVIADMAEKAAREPLLPK